MRQELWFCHSCMLDIKMIRTTVIIMMLMGSMSHIKCINTWAAYKLVTISSFLSLDPRAYSKVWSLIIKGTNNRQKTYEIFHVYCIFYSGFMCQTIVIFGITKDGSLVLNTLASWNCFTCRNLFQNGANDMSECLTCETAFCKKKLKILYSSDHPIWSNFASLW